jgi:hypothetical protein
MGCDRSTGSSDRPSKSIFGARPTVPSVDARQQLREQLAGEPYTDRTIDPCALQRSAGNWAVAQLLAQHQLSVQRENSRKEKAGAAKQVVSVEDAASIVNTHIIDYRGMVLQGVNSFSPPDEQSSTWFLLALGGNLVWASTCLAGPLATAAVIAMSFGEPSSAPAPGEDGGGARGCRHSTAAVAGRSHLFRRPQEHTRLDVDGSPRSRR